jgi:4-aminobutyrate--pyruvate transaminase
MHSYTNARRHDGIYVEDASGKRYIEAMAGLWSVAVGFSEQRLVDAATRQMKQLPFYHNFTHKSHAPVIDLAEKLVSIAPVPMSKVFFTNSGSEANDTAMKMIWYRSNALGQPQKKKIISRKRGYHGVTIASASLTGLPNNHISFDLPIANVIHTGTPHHYRDAQPGESEEAFATRLADELEQLILAEGPDTIAAFIGEPVMGAGGVVVPPATYWEKIQAVLAKYDILLVADEVICGFGRTGSMFGCETFGIRPDILVMSKQLSSSYLPISAHQRSRLPAAGRREQSHRDVRPWLYRRWPSGSGGCRARKPQNHRGERSGRQCKAGRRPHAEAPARAGGS